MLEDLRGHANLKKKDYIAQKAMFDDNPPTKMDLVAWDLLDLTQNKLKQCLIDYDAVVKNQVGNDDAMFEGKSIKPEDALELLIKGEKPQLSDSPDVDFALQRLKVVKKNYLGSNRIFFLYG